MKGDLKKTKRKPLRRGKPFEGMEKIFTHKAKRSSKALPLKGSTWLKKPPQRKSTKISGEMSKK